MDKYFIFVSTSPLSPFEIEALGHTYEDMYHLVEFDDHCLYFLSPEEDEERVNYYLRHGSHEKMMCLISPYADGFMINLAKDGLPFFPNMVVYPSDLLFKRIGFRDLTFYAGIREYFTRVPPEILETAGAYLRCGCNGLKASKSLVVHRNTFNYRLNSFITLTGLDIRDYHNALLLEIYFQLTLRSR